MNEKRIALRYPVAYPVESEKDGRIIPFEIMDLSENGISFCFNKPMDGNERIKICLFLKKKMFTLELITAYSKEIGDNTYRIGARFAGTSPEFVQTFEKEIEDIIQFARENSMYGDPNFSFREASRKYLNTGIAGRIINTTRTGENY